MRFLIDECLHTSLTAISNQAGHEAYHVVYRGWAGMEDHELPAIILREEFVRIYSEPVLQNFLDQQRKAHPGIALPDPPKTGDLDIRQVLSSPYFFA